MINRISQRSEEVISVEESSGNVFADFGIPNADEHLVKADLAGQIRRELQELRLTQVAAARLLGTSQARISDLYHGRIGQMTYDRLLGWLNALGSDVQITVIVPRVAALSHPNPPTRRGRVMMTI